MSCMEESPARWTVFINQDILASCVLQGDSTKGWKLLWISHTPPKRQPWHWEKRTDCKGAFIPQEILPDKARQYFRLTQSERPHNMSGSHKAWKQRHWLRIRLPLLVCLLSAVYSSLHPSEMGRVQLHIKFSFWYHLTSLSCTHRANRLRHTCKGRFSLNYCSRHWGRELLPCLLFWFSDSFIRNHSQPSTTCTSTHTSNLLFSRFCQFTRSVRPAYIPSLRAHQQIDLMDKIKFKWCANKILELNSHTLASKREALGCKSNSGASIQLNWRSYQK